MAIHSFIPFFVMFRLHCLSSKNAIPFQVDILAFEKKNGEKKWLYPGEYKHTVQKKNHKKPRTTSYDPKYPF